MEDIIKVVSSPKEFYKRTDYEIIRRTIYQLTYRLWFQTRATRIRGQPQGLPRYKNSIDTAKEEGREEGVAKEKLATAKRLLGMGLTQEQVAKVQVFY